MTHLRERDETGFSSCFVMIKGHIRTQQYPAGFIVAGTSPTQRSCPPLSHLDGFLRQCQIVSS